MKPQEIYNLLTPIEKKQFRTNLKIDRNLTVKQYNEHNIFKPDKYIKSAFCWNITPQGHDYWNEISENIETRKLCTAQKKTF
jgi:hypothetical protein